MRHTVFSYCFESLSEVFYNVIYVFNSDREPYRSRRYVLLGKLLRSHLRMGRGRRMDNQALNVRDVGQEGEHLQAVDEFPCIFLAAFDLEGEDRSASIGEILPVQVMVRM